MSRLSAVLLALALALAGVPAFAQQTVTVTVSLLNAPPATLNVDATGLAPNARHNGFLHAGTCAAPSASGGRLLGTLAAGPDGRGRLMTAHVQAAGGVVDLTREMLADGKVVVLRDEAGSAVACGAIPPPVAAPAQLPRTGAPVQVLADAGLLLLLLGAAARTIGRRSS